MEIVSSIVGIVVAVTSLIAYTFLVGIVIITTKRKFDKLRGKAIVYSPDEMVRVCIGGVPAAKMKLIYNDIVVLCAKYCEDVKINIDGRDSKDVLEFCK